MANLLDDPRPSAAMARLAAVAPAGLALYLLSMLAGGIVVNFVLDRGDEDANAPNLVASLIFLAVAVLAGLGLFAGVDQHWRPQLQRKSALIWLSIVTTALVLGAGILATVATTASILNLNGWSHDISGGLEFLLLLLLASWIYWLVVIAVFLKPNWVALLALTAALGMLTLYLEVSTWEDELGNPMDHWLEYVALPVAGVLLVTNVALLGRQPFPESAPRIYQTIFGGTLLNLLLTIPVDIRIRRQTECYCAEGTHHALILSILVMLSVLGPAVWWLYAIRREQRQNDWLGCRRCGFDLRYSKLRCNECNTHIPPWQRILILESQSAATSDTPDPRAPAPSEGDRP